jgi:hypothetical protein
MRKSWCNLRGASTPCDDPSTPCVSKQHISRRSRYCRRPAHPTRSPKTNVGSAPAGAPSVPSCRAPVYGRRACGLSAAPRDRARTASCVVQHDAFPPQWDVQASITEPPPLQSQFPQPLADRHIVRPPQGHSGGLRLQPDQRAGPTLRVTSAAAQCHGTQARVSQAIQIFGSYG